MDPKLFEYATKAEYRYLKAVEEVGTLRGAARKLLCAFSTVQDAVERVKRKAAAAGYSPEHDLTHPVPAPYTIKGTSTLYNEDGKVSAQWVKTKLTYGSQPGFMGLVQAIPTATAIWKVEGPTDLLALLSLADFPFGTVAAVTNANGASEKPVPWMLWSVRLASRPGHLILDPFAGSGTTGAAALRLGRRVILIEREPKWAELCRERLRAEESGSTLQARRTGQGALFK